MKISAIIFDLGKVLVDYDLPGAIAKVATKSSLEKPEIGAALKKSKNVSQYSLGKISTENFFPLLKEELKFDGALEELENFWCDMFTPMEAHIEFARQLANFYPLAILSNTDEAHIKFLEARYDFFSLFREKIYSFETGMMKPHKEIYELALQRMKADRFETLFIDDVEENILTPSRMGWQTIHLRPDVNLRYALMSYDLKGIV